MNDLVMSLGNKLQVDAVPGFPGTMCWRSIAREFGLKRWQKQGKKITSIGNLLKGAWSAGPEVFRNFIACALKRAVRLNRLRGRRPSPTNVCGPQPFWREEAERINNILKEMDQRIEELEDAAWLGGLPSRGHHRP